MNEREIEVIPIYYDYVLTKNYPVNILVGGRNSGKSYFMEQLAVINTNTKQNYKMLVIEDVETNIGEGVKNGIEQRAIEFGWDSIYGSTKQPAEVINRLTGNNVIFKGYHSDKQQKQVKSLNEVTAAWYEEAENITYEQFKALRMQLRGGDSADRQLFLTLNPINEHSFINKYFFQQQPDEVYEWFPDGRPKVFVKNIEVDLETEKIIIPCMVVVSVHWDNPYLTQEQRADIEELKHSNSDLYSMLAEGKFVKPGGTYFHEFNLKDHTCEPFEIPHNWTRFISMDYGMDMLAAHWWAIDTFGTCFVYREHCESGLILSAAAEAVVNQMDFVIDDKGKVINEIDLIDYVVASPDLWNKRQETGESGFEIMTRHGMPGMVPANNARVAGWRAMREYLKLRPDMYGNETPKIIFFKTITNAITCIPQLQYDKKKIEDAAGEPHEITHSPESIRYGIMSRPQATEVVKAPAKQHYAFETPKKNDNPLIYGQEDDEVRMGW